MQRVGIRNTHALKEKICSCRGFWQMIQNFNSEGIVMFYGGGGKEVEAKEIQGVLRKSVPAIIE